MTPIACFVFTLAIATTACATPKQEYSVPAPKMIPLKLEVMRIRSELLFRIMDDCITRGYYSFSITRPDGVQISHRVKCTITTL